MNKIVKIITPVVLLLLLVGCRMDENTEIPILEERILLVADTDMGQRTKVGIYPPDEGYGADVKWLATDTLGVFGDKSSSAAFFTTSSGEISADGKRASFHGELALDGSTLYYAYTPFKAASDRTQVPLPDLSAQKFNDDGWSHLSIMPMVGDEGSAPDEGHVNFSMKHLASVHDVTITISDFGDNSEVTLLGLSVISPAIESRVSLNLSTKATTAMEGSVHYFGGVWDEIEGDESVTKLTPASPTITVRLLSYPFSIAASGIMNFSLTTDVGIFSVEKTLPSGKDFPSGSRYRTSISYDLSEGSSLILSSKNVSVGCAVSTIEVLANSNYTYEITSPVDWITQLATIGADVTKSSGNTSPSAVTTAKYRFRISSNPSTDSNRSSYITFKDANSDKSESVNITQALRSGAASEREVLENFYNQTWGSSWENKTNWCTDEPLDQWYGVTTDGSGSVIGINLPGNGLLGRLPAGLAELGNLKTLDLSDNRIEGNIPAEYSAILDNHALSGFAFKLQGNNLSGVLPEAITSNAGWRDAAFFVIYQRKNYGFTSPEYYLPVRNFTGNKIGWNVNMADSIAAVDYTLVYFFAPGFSAVTSYTPKLKTIVERFTTVDNRYPMNFYTIGVVPNTMATSSSASNYITSAGITWNNIYDEVGYCSGSVNATAVPMVLVADKNGKVVYNSVFDGFDGVKPCLLSRLAPGITYESSDFSVDGEVVTLQTHTAGTNGVKIVILGDGFLDTDFGEGGKWETAVNTAYTYLFDIQPAAAYKEYFDVYAVKTVSYNNVFATNDSDGVVGSRTSLDCLIGAGSSVSVDGNSAKCFDYAVKAPGVTTSNLHQTLIVVMVNKDCYAGTNHSWSAQNNYGDGKAIAYFPLNTRTSVGQRLQDILHHEALGHGFMKLGDEYIKSANGDNPITDAYIANVNKYHAQNRYMNISLSGTQSATPWAHFFTASEYASQFSYVSVFEGAYFFKYGAWRAEDKSCMISNIPYFPAPSREQFAQRVIRLSGGTYSWSTFVTKDVYVPYVAGSSAAPTLLAEPFIPLPPPVEHYE